MPQPLQGYGVALPPDYMVRVMHSFPHTYPLLYTYLTQGWVMTDQPHHLNAWMATLHHTSTGQNGIFHLANGAF
jgi:hypothetical protein